MPLQANNHNLKQLNKPFYIFKPKKLANLFKYFFGEDQARYVVEIEDNNLPKVEKILRENDVYYENIGFTQNKYLEIEGELKISTKVLF